MDLNGLPADIAQFVDDALASGKYLSAEDLVAAALQVLQQQDEERGTPLPVNMTEAGSPPQSPDDYLQALAHALRVGEFGRARHLAMEGAARYPTHDGLHKAAHVLAPPTVTRASRRHTADIQANRAWLKAHWQDYAGQWIALRDGHFLAAAPSFEALAAQVDATPNVLMTKLPA